MFDAVHLSPQPETYPPAIEQLLISQLPDATAQHRQKVFDDTAEIFGAFDAAVTYFQTSIDVAASGAVLGVCLSFSSLFPTISVRCRPSALHPMLLSKRPLLVCWAIFYHSLFPLHLQHSAPFLWSFYIGLSGGDQNLIMTDWPAQGICVEVMGLIGRWEPCTLLQVTPSMRVQIMYPYSGAQVKEELIFPPDPRKASIPICKGNLKLGAGRGD
jgi:hypothetical protein